MLASVMATLFAPVLVSDTAPVKLLAARQRDRIRARVKARRTRPHRLDDRAGLRDRVRTAAFTVSVPVPTLEGPRTIASTSVTATAFAPVLFSDTAPTKLFETLFSVIAAAPALTVHRPRPGRLRDCPGLRQRTVRLDRTVRLPTFSVPSVSALVSAHRDVVRPSIRKRHRPGEVVRRRVKRDRAAPVVKLAAPAPAAWMIVPVWVTRSHRPRSP